MRIVGVIPARYGSKRFPGKPLAKILGKTMLQRVWERSRKAKMLDDIIIATDDVRIKREAENFHATAVITKKASSGTARIIGVAKKLNCSVIINIQGDEPLMNPRIIDKLAGVFKDRSVEVATLAARISVKEFYSKDAVKVITDRYSNAVYFSRTPIPYNGRHLALKHIGIYGYRKKTLLEAEKLKSPLAEAEDLEQLKFIENGIKIKVVKVKYDACAVDRKSDIRRVEKLLRK